MNHESEKEKTEKSHGVINHESEKEKKGNSHGVIHKLCVSERGDRKIIES